MSKRITTVTALAAAVGRNKSSVSRWINRPDWPFGRAPWPSSIVAKVEAWREEHLRGNDPEADATIGRWMMETWPDLFGLESQREMMELIRLAELELPELLAALGDSDAAQALAEIE